MGGVQLIVRFEINKFLQRTRSERHVLFARVGWLVGRLVGLKIKPGLIARARDQWKK